MFREQARKRLTKKAKKGFRGFPVATVAFYGPDNRRASKLAVGIVLAENEEAVELKRWFAEPGDVREDLRVAEEVLAYMEGFGVRSVAMVDQIIGCPHEEGIDYQGPTCPLCPFWAGRDRWTGERVHEPLANHYFATLADLEHVVTERCRVLNHDQLKPGTNFHWWPRPDIPA